MRMRKKKNLEERLAAVRDYLVDIGETKGGYDGLPFESLESWRSAAAKGSLRRNWQNATRSATSSPWRSTRT